MDGWIDREKYISIWIHWIIKIQYMNENIQNVLWIFKKWIMNIPDTCWLWLFQIHHWIHHLVFKYHNSFPNINKFVPYWNIHDWFTNFCYVLWLIIIHLWLFINEYLIFKNDLLIFKIHVNYEDSLFIFECLYLINDYT